jgi:L-ascorbate metabolism protein UlaG (beta-lactamase superfamily)
MRVTKYTHCYLHIEEKDANILIDPGIYSNPPTDLKLDAIFITHQHSDHVDTNLLKKIIAQNPTVLIYTCQDVADILAKEGIKANAMHENQITTVKNVSVKSVGKDHAIIYQKVPCMNQGFLVDNRLFYPRCINSSRNSMDYPGRWKTNYCG